MNFGAINYSNLRGNTMREHVFFVLSVGTETRIPHLIAALLMVALLGGVSACSGGGESAADSIAVPINTSSSAQGKIIDNEDRTAGLKGVDANSNGIRDDIDRLIEKKYARTPEIKRAAEQEARALQLNMEATTREEALRAGDAIERAAECTYRTLDAKNPAEVRYRESLSKDIEALTVNTEERFQAYWKANALMSGAVFHQSTGQMCE